MFNINTDENLEMVSSCDYYPNCELCRYSQDCWLTGASDTPNPLNDMVLHLIKWELEYRQKFDKEIIITDIVDWYNRKYYSNVTAKELDLFLNNQSD